MTEILRSLLQIVAGIILLKVICIIAIPRRIRVITVKIINGIINLVCNKIEELFCYLFKVLKNNIKAREKVESETIVEIAATSSESKKDHTPIEKHISVYEESLDETYNFLIDAIDNYSKKETKKA